MNYLTASLVTSEQPTVHLDDDGLLAIRFGAEGAKITVMFPLNMPDEAQASWCRDFAAQLTDVAPRIGHQSATVPA
jgi:hypothetical protein